MSLNIKDEETHRLVQELASLTGESMTAAVKAAVKERLARVTGEKGESLYDRLMAISRDTAARMSEETKRLDIDEFLYDENGLPR